MKFIKSINLNKFALFPIHSTVSVLVVIKIFLQDKVGVRRRRFVVHIQ